MKSPETDYVEGIKNYKGEISDYEFVLILNREISFGEFIEALTFVFPHTDYAGFHASDPNWYEEGEYKTGILHPSLFIQLEKYFRRKNLLKEDQTLRAVCHYSISPGKQYYIFLPHLRPNLVINVSGGERDRWGQFICCGITDCKDFLEVRKADNFIKSLKEMEGVVG